MSTAQVFDEEPRRLHVVGPGEHPGDSGADTGRLFAVLPSTSRAVPQESGRGPARPLAHGIRPAMHRWEIPRRERFAWRARIHANPASSLVYRIGVGVLGSALLILSLLTGWLPGPGGIPLFLIGMAVLASEFRWAHRVTVRSMMIVRHVECWSTRAKVAGIGLFGAVVVACFYVALRITGIPSWVPDWGVRILSMVPGLG